METLKPGSHIVTKHMRLQLDMGEIVHLRVGDVVLIEDVGPTLAYVTSPEHKYVSARVSTILKHTRPVSLPQKHRWQTKWAPPKECPHGHGRLTVSTYARFRQHVCIHPGCGYVVQEVWGRGASL